MNWIWWISDKRQIGLDLVGGKGANLAELARAGFPVPPAFCVSTEAYRAFIAVNGFEEDLRRIETSTQADDPAALEQSSAQIKRLFEGSKMPPDISAEITRAYASLSSSNGKPGPLAVAVRSSATAEDLPDLSFAGQQDTYLNILGEDALLKAVVSCWASLWTARAMGYRARNAIDGRSAALSVVVQTMVQSEASGVMFTANPLSGKRGEIVIDATFGLGEALVSGQVEPDHFVVDLKAGQVTHKTLGAKALSIRGLSGGGTSTQNEDASTLQALSDEQVLELARLGMQVEQHFKAPQDIEWALEDGSLFLVQSRPVTSLFPIPDGLHPDDPLLVLFSFGAMQGMLDPMTPLGQDTMRALLLGVANQFGQTYTFETLPTMLTAGERLFINFTGLARTSFGRRMFNFILEALDPISMSAVGSLLSDPRLSVEDKPMRFSTRLRLARVAFIVFSGVLYNVLLPARGRRRLNQKIDEVLDQVQRDCARTTSLAERAASMEWTLATFPPALLAYLLPGVASGQAMLQPLLRLADSTPGGRHTVLELTRGLPHNVTTEMDLALWSAAMQIKSDETSARHFAQSASNGDAATLAQEALAGTLPPAAQQAVEKFLTRYGMRGLAEIDLGRERWSEDPTQLMQVLGSYLKFENASLSPEAIFRNGADHAALALDQLVQELKHTRFGWLKARYARFAAHRIRELVGLRESPKFTAIRIMAIWRKAFLQDGRSLVEQGVIDHPTDIFFLHLSELKQICGQPERDWRGLLAKRKGLYEREKRRRQIPRLLLTDGTAFYERSASYDGDQENIITGSPVSPGVIEGRAHVVLDPRGAQLTPGEILVCPATDPGWTPLFLAAGGLVMEVGGMMTHGSVVAREYGIPAVVGVSQATSRLHTGQLIRVDGSKGHVILLD